MKKKTLIVEDMRSINSHPDAAFRIKKVTNSIHFKIGESISQTKVDAYCNANDWTVNVVGRS